MSRLYTRSSHGRTPLLPPPARSTRSKPHPGDTGSNETTKNAKLATKTVQRATLSRPNNPQLQHSLSDSEDADDSSEGNDGDADASEDEDDSEDDVEEPEVFAPSHRNSTREAGRKSSLPVFKHKSPLEEEAGLFDSDDDEIYEAVDDISDYDDDLKEEDLEARELQEILASEGGFIPDTILGEIDGMSVLGFGDDFDFEAFGAFSDSSDSAPEPVAVITRRVHFGSEVDHPNAFAQTPSPLLTRALLPSQTNEVSSHRAAANEHVRRLRSSQDFFGDPDDSDATDEDLPAEAHTAPTALFHNPLESSVPEELSSPVSRKKGKSGKKPSRYRGPPRGVFTVDKDKPWAILDPTGKKIVFLPAPDTERHAWLDEKRQQACASSVNTSPAVSFAQIFDESDRSVTSSQECLESMIPATNINVMMAGLSSDNNPPAESNGQATGPPEAFYPPDGYQIAGDYIVSPEDLNENENEANSDMSIDEDAGIKIEDLIKFDDDEDSDDYSPSTPAIYMPPLSELSGSGNVNNHFAHLNNTNVTAFRRNADPAYAHAEAERNSMDAPFMLHTAGTPTPVRGHKRKTSAPYQGKKYDGVTPVQRRVVGMRKRQKITT